MSLPDKALFTVKEAGEHLALSRASVYRLIGEGLLDVRRPRPRSTRITRESLAAHIERAKSGDAVRLAMNEGKLAKVAQMQAQQEVRKEGLLARWGLGGLTGRKS